jgi:hypothetical protein
MINLMESSIPQNYSAGLYNEKKLEVPVEKTKMMSDVTFTGVAQFLGDVKDRKFPSAFIFESDNQEFLAAGIVEFIENEDEPNNPGSWNYYWTWYKNDVPSNSKIYRVTDIQLSSYFRGVSQSKYGVSFYSASYIIDLTVYLLEKIKQWLDENASETEEIGVEDPGVFQATVVVENGEKVYSIVPEGEIKKLIKDDSSIEV